ncbi:hypothetical protein C8F01DRAFT_1179730 [Mycena amicta]|nr:hypothetical protein C8F01DRAFT_1179730 [Mycena amicta]
MCRRCWMNGGIWSTMEVVLLALAKSIAISPSPPWRYAAISPDGIFGGCYIHARQNRIPPPVGLRRHHSQCDIISSPTWK